MRVRVEDAWAELHRAAAVAGARGSLIFHLDLATEVARAAFARRGIPAASLATLVDEDGYLTIAFDGTPGRVALAEARFDPHGDVEVLPAASRQPPRAAIIAEARERIVAARGGQGGYAAIVVPADDPRRPIEGYAIAVGNDPETMQLSGHRLLTLDARARRIERETPLEAADGPPHVDVRTVRDSVMSVAGAVPSEIHTYLSLKHDVPLLVRTAASGVVWRIDGERISVPKPVVS